MRDGDNVYGYFCGGDAYECGQGAYEWCLHSCRFSNHRGGSGGYDHDVFAALTDPFFLSLGFEA